MKINTQTILALAVTTIIVLLIPEQSNAATLPLIGLGLDQWLYKKTYVKNWDHSKNKAIITLAGEKTAGIKPERISYITEEIMYWRKANQIHAFFMKNENDDHCQNVYVSSEQLQDLHARCVRIINECPLEDGVIGNGQSYTKETGWVQNTEMGKILTNQKLAHELLPTQDGFFFGNTEYNQYYMEDIVETKEMLDNLFLNEKWDHADYEYSPSW